MAGQTPRPRGALEREVLACLAAAWVAPLRWSFQTWGYPVRDNGGSTDSAVLPTL